MSAAEYDPLAWFYDRYWIGAFHELALAALDRLLLGGVHPGDTLLDLCCGSGHVARALAARGFRVVGLDASPAMLRFARRNAPAAAFAAADARAFALRPVFDGALATFDALNHLLTIGDVGAALGATRRALRPGAKFVFDVLVEEAYVAFWGREGSRAADDHACFVRGSYDPDRRIGTTDITLFELGDGGLWRRTDVCVTEAAYTPDEIASAARAAGFRAVTFHDARHDLGLAGDFAVGRVFCVAETS